MRRCRIIRLILDKLKSFKFSLIFVFQTGGIAFFIQRRGEGDNLIFELVEQMLTATQFHIPLGDRIGPFGNPNGPFGDPTGPFRYHTGPFGDPSGPVGEQVKDRCQSRHV